MGGLCGAASRPSMHSSYGAQRARCPVCTAVAHEYCTKGPAKYYRCRACRTIFQNPLPTVTDMMRYADREYAEGVYRSYVEAGEMKRATFRRRLRAFAGPADGSRL